MSNFVNGGLRQCAILVGGRGTRLGSATDHTPKPAIEVAGRPFLDYLLENVARFGFTEILLLCGYLSAIMRERFDGQTVGGARVKCLVEPEPAGTAGALYYARDYLDERFLLCNGDSLFDTNFLALVAMNVGPDWRASIALRDIPDASRYGLVRLNGTRVEAFAERGSSGSGLINGGVYLLDRRVLDLIRTLPCSIERDLFPHLATEGQLYGLHMGGYFLDIGIPSDLTRAQSELTEHLQRPAVFFDRDRVLNEDPGYLHRIEDFRWLPGARAAIRAANDSGYLTFVITNQAGIARGFYDEMTARRLHAWMNEDLSRDGAHIDAFYFCPHHPDAGIPRYRKVCDCRKPAPGMLLQAMSEWSVDRKKSFLIGDKVSDIEAAERAGITGYQISTGENVAVRLRQIMADSAVGSASHVKTSKEREK